MGYVIVRNNDRSQILDKFDWNGTPVKKHFRSKSFSPDKMFTFNSKSNAVYCTTNDAERYLTTIAKLINDESPRYERELPGSTKQLLDLVNSLSIIKI